MEGVRASHSCGSSLPWQEQQKCVMSRKRLVPKVSEVDNSRCMFLMSGSLQGTCVLFMLAIECWKCFPWGQRNKLALNSPLKPIPTANVFMLLFDLSQLWFLIRCKFYFLFLLFMRTDCMIFTEDLRKQKGTSGHSIITVITTYFRWIPHHWQRWGGKNLHYWVPLDFTSHLLHLIINILQPKSVVRHSIVYTGCTDQHF